MNMLSWMIYAADTLPTMAIAVRVFSLLAAVLATIIAVLGLTRFFGDADAVEIYDFHYRGVKKGDLVNPNLGMKAETCAKFTKPAIAAWLVFFASLLIPSQETFYAIAVIEMGEDGIKSETASKDMRALDAWLDRQIDEEVTP